ncbi:hypothetical protein DY000_02012383 [Brassica cretica]|uniref:Uncharacterized protein n=1 Tax=Brassica cretica TaxID=69181 RepID=A0ABQ7DAW5_BRACR|nr:hypothetical protein DY000_02012383 [Brassica cretica]
MVHKLHRSTAAAINWAHHDTTILRNVGLMELLALSSRLQIKETTGRRTSLYSSSIGLMSRCSKDESDYKWYTTKFKINNNDLKNEEDKPTVRVTSLGQAFQFKAY